MVKYKHFLIRLSKRERSLMKSIIQEENSITKAIEQGWIKAGRPTEFSIKIFETPQKNFWGITKRLAKIGVFFSENIRKLENEEQKKDAKQPLQQKPQPNTRPQPGTRPQPNARPEPRYKKPMTRKESAFKSQWTDKMAKEAEEWTDGAIKTLNKRITRTNTFIEKQKLIIKLDRPILNNKDSEQELLKSFSALIMQSLRSHYRKEFYGFELLITSG